MRFTQKVKLSEYELNRAVVILKGFIQDDTTREIFIKEHLMGKSEPDHQIRQEDYLIYEYIKNKLLNDR